MRVRDPEGNAKAQGGGERESVCVLAPREPLDDACWAILKETKMGKTQQKTSGTRGLLAHSAAHRFIKFHLYRTYLQSRLLVLEKGLFWTPGDERATTRVRGNREEWIHGDPALCDKDARSLSCGVCRVGRGGQTCRAMGKVLESKSSKYPYHTPPGGLKF